MRKKHIFMNSAWYIDFLFYSIHIYLQYHSWITTSQTISYKKKLILFKTIDTRILSFHVESYTSKDNIIRYYLLLNSSALKLYNKKYK